MKVIEQNNVVVIYQNRVTTSEDCINNLIGAMNYHSLDSCCAFEPNYYRAHGLFECNLLYELSEKGIELNSFCIAMKKEVFNKVSNFDIQSKNFTEQYRTYIASEKLKHGLICNAIIYAAP